MARTTCSPATGPAPRLQYPSMGSVVSHEYGPRNNLPPYVCIPNQPNEFAGTGYLSSSYAGFSLGSDPADKNFRVKDLGLPGGVDGTRFEKRRRMLDVVNGYFREKEKSDSLDALDTFYDRAYSLISSQQAREAFDMAKEPDAIKDEYGRNQAGMRMLLARRLVEAGVRFVTLTYGGWDMHENIQNGMKTQAPAARSGLRDSDSRSRPSWPAVFDARLHRVGVWPHAEDQQPGGPRPLAEGVQCGDGRRRHQAGNRLWLEQRDGQRTRGRSSHRSRLGHHDLRPTWDRGRQGTDVAGRPAHRDR